jgi:hypothetical protein
MKLTFLFFNFFILLNVTAQKLDTTRQIYLFDSLQDKYFYKIDVVVETTVLNDSYHITIGRAQRGFYVSGVSKKINIINHDTTRFNFHRLLLNSSQIDSLKIFEQNLIKLNNNNSDIPRQSFILSNQAKNRSYIIKQNIDWNPVDELLLILFRQKT